jgi:hypothetical protein
MKVMVLMVGMLLSAGNLHAGTLKTARNGLGDDIRAGKLTIARGGSSSYRIVTPDRPTSAVRCAAQELQGFVHKITGVRLPVVPERKAGPGPAFVLGSCERNRRDGLTSQAAGLAEDGVLIRTVGDNIALLGQNERGNLYSVYVLLEKYLGVRFLAWDCTIVPKRTELTLPNIDYSYAPPFMYRETLYFNSFPKRIAARQRLNGSATKCDASVGGRITFFPYVHSFNNLFPEKDYFKDHPEYYGLQGGKRVAGAINAQLCLTNPDVLQLAKAKVLKWIEEHPDIPVFDVSQNDGGGPCECDNCTAIVKEEGSQHGPILRFVNAIADEVAARHPDKWVETLAYAYSLQPPSITKPRPNVIIRLCHVGCYFHGFGQCNLGQDMANWVDQWSSVTRRIFIWHYGTDFAHYLAPNQNLVGLAKDIRFYGSHRVNGLMVQCNYQGPGGELAELRQYLASQLMWDPRTDPMEIRADFCRGYYGRASTEVMEFLQLMDKVAQDPGVHGFGAWDPQGTVSPQFVGDSLKILERAKIASDTPIVRNRVGKLMLPYWYMKLTFPAKYGLSDADGAALLRQARQVIDANRITHIREGEANAASWLAEMDARYAPKPKNLVFDLRQLDRATTTNCADWRSGSVEKKGRAVATIFQHPPEKGDADATYEIDLPQPTTGKKVLMRFATVISNASTNGVRFAVLVNENELWSETKTAHIPLPGQPSSGSGHDSILPGKDPFSDQNLDLSKYAGQKIRLTLRVNALGDSAYDWANWVEPRIMVGK